MIGKTISHYHVTGALGAALLELLEEKGLLTQTEVLERVTLIKPRGKPQ